MRDPKYDILFEPVPIGPLMAKNRFFQVPHCNGMGYRDPVACAEMRAVKTQGGWAVVCTEEAEIHYTSEVTPYVEARIWDDSDIPALARMTERVHDCGALAGIELAYNGLDGSNLHSRVVPQAPSALPVISGSTHPVQARAMTKRDIANLRRWHRRAVDRSLRAGGRLRPQGHNRCSDDSPGFLRCRYIRCADYRASPVVRDLERSIQWPLACRRRVNPHTHYRSVCVGYDLPYSRRVYSCNMADTSRGIRGNRFSRGRQSRAVSG